MSAHTLSDRLSGQKLIDPLVTVDRFWVGPDQQTSWCYTYRSKYKNTALLEDDDYDIIDIYS